MSDAASQRGQRVHGALRGLARHARSGVQCAAINANKAIGDPWHDEVVRPLRDLRNQWRNAALEDAVLMTLRMKVKTLELEAEQSLMLKLEALTGDWPAREARNAEEWLIELADGEAKKPRCAAGAAHRG